MIVSCIKGEDFMGEKVIIKVDTNKLLSAASSLEELIKETKEQIDEISLKVKDISYFWEGEGANTHLESFNHRVYDADQYIQAVLDSVDNLRTAAGIYNEAEKTIITSNKGLVNNVLSD